MFTIEDAKLLITGILEKSNQRYLNFTHGEEFKRGYYEGGQHAYASCLFMLNMIEETSSKPMKDQ